MWVMIGHDYLNLDNIDCVRFTRDQDGTFSASVEPDSGHVRHYQGSDAENLKAALDALIAAPIKLE